jgi:uncharacterized protein YrrD
MLKKKKITRKIKCLQSICVGLFCESTDLQKVAISPYRVTVEKEKAIVFSNGQNVLVVLSS